MIRAIRYSEFPSFVADIHQKFALFPLLHLWRLGWGRTERGI